MVSVPIDISLAFLSMDTVEESDRTWSKCTERMLI